MTMKTDTASNDPRDYDPLYWINIALRELQAMGLVYELGRAPQWKDRLEDNPSRQEVLGDGMTMKIVSINNNPSACEDGGIRRDVTSLDAIVNNIDTCEGRNAALKAYVYALRDLQVAHNESPMATQASTTSTRPKLPLPKRSTGWSSANTRSIGFQPICREEKIRHHRNRYTALPSVRQAIRAGRARDHRLDVNRRVGNRASGLLAPMAEARTITNSESHEGFSQPPMKART